MDRLINYAGQVPLETDLLNTNRNTMIGLGMALQAILGTGTWFDGLACTPTGPASLQVYVGSGSCYAIGNVDGTTYSSLAADTTHQIVKQGISLDTVTLTCAAPGTVGYSINYLVQAAYTDTDSGSTVLPYYNSSNPAVPYSGPSGLGTSQNTVRKGAILISAKAGTAATTGTQATPAPDGGYTGLYVITVANGQTQITSPNIVTLATAPFIPFKLPTLPLRTRLSANTTYYVATTGNDSTGTGVSSNPWLTIQKAIDYVNANIDLNGYIATIQVADGTYTTPVVVNAPFVGAGRNGYVQLQGNNGTPANCIISTTSAAALAVWNNASVYISGFKIQTTTSGDGLRAEAGGHIFVSGNMNFGSCAASHFLANGQSYINIGSNYTISGNAATAHYNSNGLGEISVATYTITLSGTPSFGAFAQASSLGLVSAVSLTFSGSGTGPRYNVVKNGVIDTNGGGSTYFPGNSAGSATTGSYY